MFTVPGAIAVTVPELEPTVAIDVLPLIHVPPGVPSDKVVVPLTQRLTDVDGVIDAGVELTVTPVIAKQPALIA